MNVRYNACPSHLHKCRICGYIEECFEGQCDMSQIGQDFTLYFTCDACSSPVSFSRFEDNIK
jgi:hypothetical protein